MQYKSATVVFAALCITLLSPAAFSQATRPSSQAYRTYAMMHQGSADAGRSLFNDSKTLACTQCHTIAGTGGKAGPDLFAIGDKYGRDDLITSILDPSATIAVGYSTTVIRTKDGQLHQGIVKEASNDFVVLMEAQAKTERIASGDIADQRVTGKSFMPEGLASGLTVEQFADLISYLTTLKAPQSDVVLNHGMPLEIPALKTPVTLIPFSDPAKLFSHPTWFGSLPGVKDTYAVTEHFAGKIWLLKKTPDGEQRTVFLDLGKQPPNIKNLLGIVFHPEFATNRKYYFVRHELRGRQIASHVYQAEASQDLLRDSGKPPVELLELDAFTDVHYGGCLQFGPDGYLYIGMGDTGPQGDPGGHAQNLSMPLGKMLRIDVEHPDAGKMYGIPKDNPFIGVEGARPEIFAYGLREPWRFTFDPPTGDLWVGDVGQDLFEEVDIVRRGENMGWNVFEGFQRFSNKYRVEGRTFTPPVFAYTRKYGQSVTGGYVYRADKNSSFYGVYIFADYQSGRLFALTQKDRVLDQVRLIGQCPQHAVSIGKDDAGNLYVVGYEGTIYRIDLSNTKFE